MNKWKSEKEAAESQINRLRSENQRLEGHYNLLLKSEFYQGFLNQCRIPTLSGKVGSDPKRL